MIAFAVALLCGAAGGFLAWQHPIAPIAAVTVFALATALSFVRPRLWLFALPALIPVVSFASWTGSMAIEEIDLVGLALAAGAYARLPLSDRGGTRAAGVPGVRERPQHLSVVAVTFVTLFALSIAGALYRGVVDAGGLRWGLYDGYYEALNSVRIGKSFALVLLFAPLLLVAMREPRGRAVNLLASGFAIGAGLAAMTVVWERYAFTGLLNFSSDYRATGMFWEMHVGGAALDGYLALGVPFVVWAFMRASGRNAAAAAAGGLSLLVSYACLATFSRGVYLAIPISLALLFLLRPAARDGGSAPRLATLFKAGLAIAAVALASFFVFRAGGYRSLLAALGVLALSLQLSSVVRGATLIEWAMAAVVGIVLALVGMAAGSVVGKGPYLVYAVAFAVGYGLTFQNVLTDRPALQRIAILGSFLWLAFCAVHVARHWGGDSAQWDMAIVIALLVLAVVARTRSTTPRWPIRLREQGIVLASAAVVAGSAAVMLGGAYMGERFATSEQDFEGRIQHWRDGLSLLATPADWMLGKGLGRFPNSYFFGAPDAQLPGSYRVATDEGNAYLVLSGPRHPFSFGELFRIAQRVPITPGPYTLTFDARAPVPALLHVEVCQQHLLYNGACAVPSPKITVRGDAWQPYAVTLDGRYLEGGPWYAPRLAFFAFAVEAQGLRVDLDNVSLIGPRGRNLIENGDFANGTARWFIVSERIHLPWHIKNMAFNVLFDQGAVGLLLFVLLVGGTLWRLTAGHAHRHPMAPFLTASLVGFLVVGAFDSLLDVPRVALAFYLVLFAGLALEEPPRETAAPLRVD